VKLSMELTEEAKATVAGHEAALAARDAKRTQQASEPDEDTQKLTEIESLYESELEKSHRMKRLVGQKGRSIAALQRRLDDVPNRAELVQYERRFRELYNQVAYTLEETKKYYNLYNTLEERKLYLTKEVSIVNSIHDNFNKVAVGGRDKLVDSIEGLTKSVQQNLDKVNGRFAEEVGKREALQATYDKLVEKERKYYKLVREFQAEALQNEQLATG